MSLADIFDNFQCCCAFCIFLSLYVLLHGVCFVCFVAFCIYNLLVFIIFYYVTVEFVIKFHNVSGYVYSMCDSKRWGIGLCACVLSFHGPCGGDCTSCSNSLWGTSSLWGINCGPHKEKLAYGTP